MCVASAVSPPGIPIRSIFASVSRNGVRSSASETHTRAVGSVTARPWLSITRNDTRTFPGT